MPDSQTPAKPATDPADTPENTVVWTEIPVSDLPRAVAFYNAVFGWEMTIDETGPNPMADFAGKTTGVGGHLYPGTPAKQAGPTIHFAAPDGVEATIERCRAAGGAVQGPIIPLPFGRFVYATDPDGNSIGFYEATG